MFVRLPNVHLLMYHFYRFYIGIIRALFQENWNGHCIDCSVWKTGANENGHMTLAAHILRLMVKVCRRAASVNWVRDNTAGNGWWRRGKIELQQGEYTVSCMAWATNCSQISNKCHANQVSAERNCSAWLIYILHRKKATFARNLYH